MAVYVLVDETRVCCKIGFSKDGPAAKKRVKALQTSSPFKLELICINDKLNRQDEQHVHRKLTDHWTGGGKEWFDYRASEVLECVEFVKLASDTMFPEKPTIENVAVDLSLDCQCNCSHAVRDDEECCECLDLLDEQSGLCLACVWKDTVLGEPYDTLSEFCEHVEMLASDNSIDEKAFVVRAYLSERCNQHVNPLSPSTLFQLLLEGNHAGAASRARVADLVYRLNLLTNDDDYPLIFQIGGDIWVVFEGDLAERMPEAEERYEDCFWFVDCYGPQLFVSCLSESRELKDVPYGAGWDREVKGNHLICGAVNG